MPNWVIYINKIVVCKIVDNWGVAYKVVEHVKKNHEDYFVLERLVDNKSIIVDIGTLRQEYELIEE